MNSRRILSIRSFSRTSLRQLIIGLLELTDGLFEVGAQAVERLAEAARPRRFPPPLPTYWVEKSELAHAVGERRHGDSGRVNSREKKTRCRDR